MTRNGFAATAHAHLCLPHLSLNFVRSAEGEHRGSGGRRRGHPRAGGQPGDPQVPRQEHARQAQIRALVGHAEGGSASALMHT